MSNLELSQKFLLASHPEKSQLQIDMEALLPGICRELERKGVTKEMLYRQYIEKYPEGYGISRFCGLIRLYLAQHRPVMHIEHKAGDKMYIDFTGQKLQLDNGDGSKTEVEGAVKLVYKTIFTKLDKRIFYDRSSLNAAIRVALEIHNNTPMYKREYSRRQQFEEIERDVLQNLNSIRYELKEQAQLTVWKNGYIRLGVDTHYYSVPYKYIGKTVKVLYSSQSVEVYYRHELIAQHVRNRHKYQYTTNTEHLASQRHTEFLQAGG